MSDIKMWGKEPFWGLGLRIRSAMAADRRAEEAAEDAHRSLPELDARECRRERQEAPLPAQEFPDPRQARLPRPDRAEGTGRHGPEPCGRGDGGGDHRALRLPLDRHVLHHASGRRRGGPVPPSQQPDAQGHPQAHRQGLPGRHPLLFRPGDRLSLLVPDFVGRQEGRWRLAGDARRRPGRRRAASPTGTSSRPPARISAATTPTSPASSSSATRSRPIPPSGTASACAATSPARWRSTTRPSRTTAWSARSMTAPIPTTSASIRSSCCAPRPAGTASRWH